MKQSQPKKQKNYSRTKDYEHMSQEKKDTKLCRKLMMLKIQRTLVKHPYDNVGDKKLYEGGFDDKQAMGTTGKCFKVPTRVKDNS